MRVVCCRWRLPGVVFINTVRLARLSTDAKGQISPPQQTAHSPSTSLHPDQEPASPIPRNSPPLTHYPITTTKQPPCVRLYVHLCPPPGGRPYCASPVPRAGLRDNNTTKGPGS